MTNYPKPPAQSSPYDKANRLRRLRSALKQGTETQYLKQRGFTEAEIKQARSLNVEVKS
jgi:hypothetical protein